MKLNEFRKNKKNTEFDESLEKMKRLMTSEKEQNKETRVDEKMNQEEH